VPLRKGDLPLGSEVLSRHDCLYDSPIDKQDEGGILLLFVRRKSFMADKPSDLVQGTLDMLILKTLALEPMHGYGIAVPMRVRYLWRFSDYSEMG
jgi:hypothetical protein